MCPITPHHKNKKLQHLYHEIDKTFVSLEQNTPSLIIDITKYDLVCRNINEAILLIAFRSQQKENFLKYSKKVTKMINKL